MMRGRSLRGSISALALALAAAGAGSAALAQALPQIQKPARDYEAMQRNTVGIATGGPQGVYARLGSDLLRLLDDRKGESLRLEVLLGSGSVNNLDDLWNLRGVSSKADKVAEFNRQWAASGHTVATGDPDYMEGFAGWSRRACP